VFHCVPIGGEMLIDGRYSHREVKNNNVYLEFLILASLECICTCTLCENSVVV
jgi:hypothetical protein